MYILRTDRPTTDDRKWSATFQLKWSKVKVTGRQKAKKYRTSGIHVYLRAADQATAAQEPIAN